VSALLGAIKVGEEREELLKVSALLGAIKFGEERKELLEVSALLGAIKGGEERRELLKVTALLGAIRVGEGRRELLESAVGSADGGGTMNGTVGDEKELQELSMDIENAVGTLLEVSWEGLLGGTGVVAETELRR
jgi:hypothetical protein